MVSVLKVNSFNHILFLLSMPHINKRQIRVIEPIRNNLVQVYFELTVHSLYEVSFKDGNSSAPPPDLPPPPFSPSVRGIGGGNVFPPPLVGGVRGGGGTDTKDALIPIKSVS